MRLLFSLASVALVAVACGPHVSSAQLNKPPRELAVRAPAEVDIFTTQRPTRAYMEYASIEIYGADEKARLVALRGRAGAIGCDAVLVTNTAISIEAMKATCIIYTEPASKDGATKDGVKEIKETGSGTKL